MNYTLAGLPWYPETEYEALRALFTDGNELPTTYAEWLKKWEIVERGLKEQGVKTVRAEIHEKGFVAWCQRNRMPLTWRSAHAFADAYAQLLVLGKIPAVKVPDEDEQEDEEDA
jgi:hypothetical protein